MIIVLDWSAFVKNISFSILSGSMACSYPTEPDEIAHRVMKRLFCIRAEHPKDTIIFACDHKPYWRSHFLLDWYSDRGIEPVIYKGNRTNMTWPFATTPENMESLHDLLLEDGAKAIGGVVVKEKGLEADDIWGILVKSTPITEFLAYTSDSDWRQLITKRVKVYDFTTDTLHEEPIDVRLKWIGGDSGDGIKGCTKLKKDGTPAKNGYGPKTAEKLLMDYPDTWQKFLDKEELERNKTVITLPCPLWDVDECAEHLCFEDYREVDSPEIWDHYGVTEPVRNLLTRKSERQIFIQKLRSFMQKTEPLK